MTKFSAGDSRAFWRPAARGGAAVLASLALAAGVLITSEPRAASAVFVTPPVFTAPIQAAGLTETWTISGWQGSSPFHISSATVEFPAGFVLPASPTATVRGNGVDCTVWRTTTTGQSVLIEISGSCETSAMPGAGPAKHLITIAGVKNPTTPGVVAGPGFKLSTSVDGAMSSVSDVTIWGMTATSLCYAPGGQSRAQVQFVVTPAGVAANTGSGTVSSLIFSTSAGEFPQRPAMDLTLGASSAFTPGGATAFSTVRASVLGGSVALVDVLLPASTTAATVTARVTPANGGASVLLASSDVTFNNGVCVPPAVVTPPAPPAAAAGTFSGGTIAPSGVSIVSFTGTTAQLNTAGATAKLVSVTATVGGKALTFVVGAPDFVNAEFNAAFPAGLSGTLVIVKA